MLPYFPFGQQFNDKMGTYPFGENDPLIDVDDNYPAELLLKRALLSERPDYYYQTLPGCETAQWEALELILTTLAQTKPDQFTLHKEQTTWHWNNHLLNEKTDFIPGDSSTLPTDPLNWAGLQVQEDLLLLAGEDASLVAGHLCFANDWCLDEKLGLPFWQIHAPIIPIVEPMMRAAQKSLERLPVGRPVWRLNWSVKVTDQLDMTSRHLPALKQALAEQLPYLTPNTIGNQLFIRVERQTLTRLPRSGAILFGIHTYQNRLANEVNSRPGGAAHMANVFSTTPPAMLDYKSMTDFLPALLTYLHNQ
ncbi:heme-dependent oxidative N-demethylase family protein [Spirosoma pollinicola]|uniref:DUF3445 domain-containing protein n=1 Tax=Spirosoma pollinicola TaxID=2057025 RepID=A0A2K8Z951_9BACT|nr:DUF3445 domain-containing protein [Spirosoma pollinicola]AUD06397.1 hypothetical protein CWM47_33900 [Spirosoma pollinicola]